MRGRRSSKGDEALAGKGCSYSFGVTDVTGVADVIERCNNCGIGFEELDGLGGGLVGYWCLVLL